MQRTTENYLRWQFGRWISRGYAAGVSLFDADAPAGVPVDDGEAAIVRVCRDAHEPPLILTDRRLIAGDTTLFTYHEVRACHYINRGQAGARSMKQSHPFRVVVVLEGGRELVFDDLGQAAFPLMSFLNAKVLRDRTSAAAG